MAALESQEELFFSDLLKAFRLRKKLTQQRLAEKIEVTRETVSLWERGEYKPEADRILYKIVDVLGLSDQEQAQLFEAYTVTALKTSFHQPLFKRNPYFTGRDAQLGTLHRLLMAGKQVALTQAISGLGGIGKTQLALEYAYCYQKSYHDIFWANADTEEALMASSVQIAHELHLPEAKEADQNKIKEAVRRWFQMHTNWLLIVDNIEDLRLLSSFVPENRQGAVLLTTRRQVTEPVAQALELEVLPEEDAIQFLLKRTRVLALDASLAEASCDEIEAARPITRLLGHLPLALDQAGAYILETACGFAEYAAVFQTHRERLLQRRIGESIPTDHPESVTTTFTLNFEQAQKRNRVAADLLRLCTYLAPDAIAEEVLTEGATLLGSVLSPVATDAFLLNQAIEVLQAFSLVRRDSGRKMLSIHRLVQAVLQDQQDPVEQQMWTERAVRAVNAAFPHTGSNAEYTVWTQCERLLSLALVAAEQIEQQQMMFEDAGRLLLEAATYLWRRARYGEAEPLFQRALSIFEQRLGPDHLDVASPLNNLASLYWQRGRYAEAEPLFQRALSIFEQRLGPDHPQAASPINNLASLYVEQGRHAEAEILHQRALSIREQRLGPDHLDVASSLNNLAGLYKEQGKYAEAEPLFQRALSIWEQQLGSQHPHVSHPLNGLASLYAERGRYAEAEQLYQRALSIREQRLGLDHPQVTYPLANLAELYLLQDKFAEAEPLFQRAVRIREQRLGLDHPQVAYPLTNLAKLYLRQGRYTEAELLFRRALHINEQGLDPEHPDVAYTLHGLATLYQQQGKDAEAELLYQRALSIREQRLGSDHPDTAETLHDLAAFREQQGRHQEALALYQRALSIREQALGETHPKTRATRERLTALREQVGHEAGVPPEEDISSEQGE